MRRSLKLYSTLILVIALCILLNCSRESKKDEIQDLDLEDSTNELNTCDACILDSFLIETTSQLNGEKITIEQPVAIQFFNRVRLVDTLETENYDSLMELLKMRHWSERGEIYSLKGQYFYFEKAIKPLLLEQSVKLMDSLKTNQLIEFRFKGKSIVVNANAYSDEDGVLFYLPGKKPIFWSADLEEKYCKNGGGLAEQYFGCR